MGNRGLPSLGLKGSRHIRVVFVHPDLGIGGAERLVVDAALALKRKGLCPFTAHHALPNLETWTQEKTTNQADCVLVNSHFTASVYKETFKSIKTSPSVLYPSLDFENFDKYESLTVRDVDLDVDSDCIFLSLNRYERKKNINLALHSMKLLLDMVNKDEASHIHLIVAGGYDDRVQENIEHYSELVSLATSLGISDKVTFLKSPSNKVKVALLRSARCLLYTPDKEHFGIVPIESMYVGTPVIAVNSGGPRDYY
ncbi:Alpha-1-3/1-6-mannosyltransferase ALG2-like [Homarus americanus]|uniref:Alpha-1,3/1,6-mannosyltransferase ALG2 n=1 Tax=Homarus americanus TaxID=6706 RepID=A0A8J5JEU4_HOMAM|nr:Alpha-1-3/1-6-mannosyltransferase ALG2-like [Homarus americanus]